jgi:hypothetical protein
MNALSNQFGAGFAAAENAARGRLILLEAFYLICLAGFLTVLSGCATGPRIDWNSRIGTYTYDQAVLELGPPDRSATLTDNTKVVEWLTSRGQTYGFADYGGFYHPYHFYSGPFIHHYSLSRGPDYFLRLTFSPEGKLLSWKRVAR